MHANALLARNDTQTSVAPTPSAGNPSTPHDTLLPQSRRRGSPEGSEHSGRGGVRIGLSAATELAQSIHNLASAAGVTLETLPNGHAAALDLLICDADALPNISQKYTHADSRAPGLIVVCHKPTLEIYALALQHGALRVVALPEESEWLLAHLITCNERPTQTTNRIFGVVGGSAGAGASCFATVMANEANAENVLLVDTDPLAGGLDLLSGIESEPGLRWHDLQGTSGTVPSTALRDSLPASRRVATLSFGRETAAADWGHHALPIIEALSNSVDLCVIDLARQHPLMPTIASMCHEIFVLVPRQVRPLAATLNLLDRDSIRHLNLNIITRAPAPTGISPQDVASMLGREVIADINLGTRGNARLMHALDLGIGPNKAAGRGRHSLRRVAQQCVARIEGTS